MKEYICDKCLKNYGNQKSHWENHMNRKRPCVSNNLSNAPFCLEINEKKLSDGEEQKEENDERQYDKQNKKKI